MKNKLIITEEEKNSILNLHKLNIQEQGDYSVDKQEKEVAKLDSLAVDTGMTNPDNLNDPKVKYSCVVNHPYVTIQTPNNQASRYIWGNLYFTLDGFYFKEGNEADKFTYFCDGNVINTSKDGRIKPSMNQIIKQQDSKSNEIVKTDFDKKYNYKKDGDKYYFQLKSTPDKWTEATGSAKSAIGVQVFGDKSACQFPAKADACAEYDGVFWKDNPEKDKIDTAKTKIGFCSTNYCTVKWIQDTLNDIIKKENSVGHEKLKGMNPLSLDGKFGTTTQNYIYKLLGKVNTTADEVSKQHNDK